MGKWILMLEIGCAHVFWHTFYSEVQSGWQIAISYIYAPHSLCIRSVATHRREPRIYTLYIHPLNAENGAVTLSRVLRIKKVTLRGPLQRVKDQRVISSWPGGTPRRRSGGRERRRREPPPGSPAGRCPTIRRV
jgi:hypothetical protein